jgi:hypothetical protein
MSGLLRYSLEFRGQVSGESDGLLVHASAPPCTHQTQLHDEGIAARFFFGDSGDEAFLESRLLLEEDGTFSAVATIDFGHGHTLWGRTLDNGRVSGSADEHLRHGTATIHVVGGTGQFAGATGQITSNFVLSDTGELTDNQLGMVFLQPNGRPPGASAELFTGDEG